jgi:hypothetical protein
MAMADASDPNVKAATLKFPWIAGVAVVLAIVVGSWGYHAYSSRHDKENPSTAPTELERVGAAKGP